MSVSINELIAKREEIKARKSQKLTIETSLGEVVAKKPTTLLMTEALGLDGDNDEYIVYNCIVEPNLKDKDLLPVRFNFDNSLSAFLVAFAIP